ncbi:hypothetical protein L7F22_015268 [Adiantum nelumboides]|nr:hypothetical protein [Adiantum nelumboides]
MAVSFPTFYGHHDENARDFMDSLEMAHLMAGRDQEEVKLRAFPLVLKGEARVWYDALAPPSKATWRALYGAFLNKYGQGDTPENLWKQLLRHRQCSLGDYNTYESKFTNLWERWAASLQGQGGAPNFLKRDKFVEGMFPTLKEKVEAKFSQTFEEAQEIATVKFKKLLYQERKSNCVKEREEAPTRGQQPRDDARPLRRSTQELRCWNCNETGHGMYHCSHPRRILGDMYPPRRPLQTVQFDVPQQPPTILRRPPPPPQPMAAVPPMPEQPEEQGVNIIKLEEPEELNVMPAIKRTRAQERDEEMKSDTSDEPKKGKKKVKEDEAESSKKKKSRQPQRVIGIDDFPLGKNLEPYDMVEDLKSQRPNITWPQLMHLSSSIHRQWPKLASTKIPKKRKEKVVKSIKSNTPKDIEPIVDAYIKGKRVSNVYVDGGAQMCVITERTMHRLGLSITEPSDCHAKLANNSKVKCLGIIKDVHITVLDVSAKLPGGSSKKKVSFDTVDHCAPTSTAEFIPNVPNAIDVQVVHDDVHIDVDRAKLEKGTLPTPTIVESGTDAIVDAMVVDACTDAIADAMVVDACTNDIVDAIEVDASIVEAMDTDATVESGTDAIVDAMVVDACSDAIVDATVVDACTNDIVDAMKVDASTDAAIDGNVNDGGTKNIVHAVIDAILDAVEAMAQAKVVCPSDAAYGIIDAEEANGTDAAIEDMRSLGKEDLTVGNTKGKNPEVPMGQAAATNTNEVVQIVALPPASCEEKKRRDNLCIILDMNGLLIRRYKVSFYKGIARSSTLDWARSKYRVVTGPNVAGKMQFEYVVKPNASKFLDALLTRAQVALWSCMTQENLALDLSACFPRLNKQLFLDIIGQEGCREASFKLNEVAKIPPCRDNTKPVFFKCLKDFWEHYTKFNFDNTLVVIDTLYKCLLNPPETWVCPASFEPADICQSPIYLVSTLFPWLVK